MKFVRGTFDFANINCENKMKGLKGSFSSVSVLLLIQIQNKLRYIF